MQLSIELDREEDGRWIAEALELRGVITYGSTPEEAICNTERLAIEVIADRIKHGELPASPSATHQQRRRLLERGCCNRGSAHESLRCSFFSAAAA